MLAIDLALAIRRAQHLLDDLDFSTLIAKGRNWGDFMSAAICHNEDWSEEVAQIFERIALNGC